MIQNKTCYWCGDISINKEHCPPQNLFRDFDKLITVPSCKKHNNEFSSLDSKMEQFIKIVCGTSVKINLDKTILKWEKNKKLGNEIRKLFSQKKDFNDKGYLIYLNDHYSDFEKYFE